MSFFRDIQHFAGQSLSSINASARKLASSISTESNGSTSNDMTGPNIEVSEASSSASELKKRPGPLLIRSPEVVASMPLSPGVHFSRRRPSLGISPSSGGRKSPFGNTLDPPSNNLGKQPCSSPTSPSRRTTSCKGRLVNSSFRESFKKVKTADGSRTVERENCESKSSRRPSVVQHELNKQKPKLDTKLYPNYTDMPRMWAEVSDTQKQVSQIDNEFLEFYGSLQLCHESKKRQYFDEWKSIDESPPSQSSLGIEPVIPQVDKEEIPKKAKATDALSKQERENLYKEVLYTITHKLGNAQNSGQGNLANHFLQMQQKKPNALSAALAPLWQTVTSENKSKQPSKDDLLTYAQEAFDIDDETHSKLMEEVKEEKPPIVVLNLIVVEADKLEAKDSNGYSDPFCMLGIRPGDSVPAQRSPREKSPNIAGRHRGSFDWSAIGEASSALFGIQSPLIKAAQSDLPELSEEGGDKVGSLPESMPKTSEKFSKRAGSFRISFKRRETKKVPKSPANLNKADGNSVSSNCSSSSNGNGNGTLLEPMQCQTQASASPMQAKIIRATSVKPKTLSPKWHERFRFDCDDVSTDILHLDIWDHDDEASVMDAVKKLNEVKGIRGLERYFKQVAQSARFGEGSQDDFLGSIDIPIRDIPVQGLDMWYKLEGRTQRSNIQGSIHVKMWLSTRENRGLTEEEGMWNEIWQHQQIYTILLRHQILNTKEWNGQLSEAATAILQQHATQGDLTELQVIALRWRALAQQAKDESHQIHFKVLFEALKDLEKHWDRDLLSNEEERALGEALCFFVEYGLLLLQHHRKLFTPKNKPAFEKLDYLLKCFQFLSEMKVSHHCYPQVKDIKMEIVYALKKGVTAWFMTKLDADGMEDKLDSRVPLSGKDYREILEKLNDLLIDVNAHLESGNRYYNFLFEKALCVNFNSIVYKQYDKLISEEICPILLRTCERDMSLGSCDLLLPPAPIPPSPTLISGAAQETSEEFDDERRERWREERQCDCCEKDPNCRHFLTYDLFEVCLALREVYTKRKCLLPQERKSLCFSSSYHDWFIPPFAAWLAIVSEQLPRRVQKAVECEKLVTSILHNDLKHSTSCRDVTSSFYHIKDLWHQMGWQELHNNRSLLAGSVDIICKNATLYTDILLKKSGEQTLYFLEEKGFKVSEEFCIAMNNIEHVCECVKSVPHDFGISEDRASLSSTSSNIETTALDSFDHLLEFVITTVDQIDLAIYSALEPISKKLQPAMKKHIFHLAWSPESLPTVDAISPLLDFLNARLQDYNGRLLKGNVVRCLHIMWESVLNEIADHVEANTSEQDPKFYDRLYEALHLLVDFFSINGQGLTGAKLLTETYNKMELLYGLNKMTTAQLIDLYHRERLNDQYNMLQQYQALGDVPPNGTICIRVYFRNDCLFVEILNARDVIPLDNNGLSDPFVVVELLPKRVFHCEQQQTHVQKATLNPTFDECFEFPAYYEQLMEDDAMVLFSLYDYDVLTCNDFGGEAFFPLRDVPGTQRGKVGNFHGLKQVELALMFQENPDQPILQVLSDRHGDRVAQDFVKKQKERIIQ